MKVRLVAVLSVLVLGSSASLANMLLLGAGGGGSGGGGGPTTVYQCADDYSLSAGASASAPDGDGYRTITTTSDWATARQPSAENLSLVDGTTYTSTMEIKNTGAASYVFIELYQDGTRRMGGTFATSNGAYQSGFNLTSHSTTDLGGGKYRVSLTGSVADWTGNARLHIGACTDGDCNDSPVNTTFIYNTSTCSVTTP